jgi:hypothetical protein
VSHQWSRAGVRQELAAVDHGLVSRAIANRQPDPFWFARPSEPAGEPAAPATLSPEPEAQRPPGNRKERRRAQRKKERKNRRRGRKR